MSRNNSRQVKAAQTTRTRAAANARQRQVAVPVNECVIYARVSSKDQEKEGFSIPSQLRLLRDYATENGLTVVDEFVDIETAKRAGRTNFSRMLDALRGREGCRTVLVEKTDRLYRNISDWVTLDELHLDIHLVKEGTVLSEGSRSSEKFIHGIKVLMAKNYIDNLSEETRKGMFEKVQQGIWPGPAPLGYRNIRRADGKNVIEVDLDVAPKVVQLFQRYASGDVALSELVKWADSVGLRSKKGNKIHKTAIHYILRNRIYVGEFSWQGTTWPAKHQPLISRELFEKVGDRLEARALVSRNTQFREFAFSGILWCGWCASEDKTYLLVPENHKVKYTYYTCQECKKLGRVVYHREHIIEAAFLEQLKQLWIEPEVLEQLREALHASHAEIVAARNREVARLQQQIGQIQQRLDRAYDDRLDGRLSIEEYERRAQGWRDDQGRLFVELDAHAGADQATMEQGIALLELATTAVRLWERQDATAKRKILSYLTLNSTYGGEGLSVVWREPFDQLAEYATEARNEYGRRVSSPAERSGELPLLDLN
ncbi:MAG: recombinase family protein [Alphaproteobacteria bacterium]|nr:recombinase family protein [Alphaproteobacteria bacterium]MCB9696281.1 recombinase family protein [Alphaproteobacteria bacterium]